ncbi:Agamous-like MADS-box protein AGL80 [Euphorbia peplus]|nr:Agamous-like MADS-box protein AGL80 [Euphorbia peplus]
MTRRKVKLAFIENDSTRRVTYRKRKNNLMKKVNELSTLCGVQACAIVYSPYDDQPEVWPTPEGVQQVLSRFKEMPVMDQSKKMVNQVSFLQQRVIKGNDQMKKLTKENRQGDVTRLMYQCLAGKSVVGLNLLDLNDLKSLIDENVKDIIKLEALNKDTDNSNPNADIDNNTYHFQDGAGAGAVPVAAPTSLMVGASAEEAVQVAAEPEPPQMGSDANVDGMQMQQWFMDMINPPNQIGFGGGPVGGADEPLLPFFDQDIEDGLWSSAFFP